jgi:hypothetical protein
MLLFQRNAPAERVLTNTLALQPDDGAPAERTFGSAIELLHHSIAQNGPRRLRASFTWRLKGAEQPGGRFVAVSRLEGVADARMVHLPSYALLPIWQWPRDRLVVETFEVELPEGLAPGRYDWRLGWYNVGLPASYATDARSLMPGSQEALVETLTLR